MPVKAKEMEVRARIAQHHGEKLQLLAEVRGEAVAVLVRTAIYEFLIAHGSELSMMREPQHKRASGRTARI